ncbi:MAG: hypothetical protein KJ025_00390 [Burkholderiales bacterium]|nr:hypothetical protein [Burkholderiales bacterium]
MKPTRRQLLKGSLAAPLVLTARPASAWALSSAAACKVRDAEKASQYPEPEKLSHWASDEWLRVNCDLHELKVYSSGSWKKLDGKYFLGADKSHFWKVTESSGQLHADKTKYTVSNCDYKKTGERKYGLCYVDDDGHQCGFAWEDHGGKCVTKSCWTSIKAQRV